MSHKGIYRCLVSKLTFIVLCCELLVLDGLPAYSGVMVTEADANCRKARLPLTRPERIALQRGVSAMSNPHAGPTLSVYPR